MIALSTKSKHNVIVTEWKNTVVYEAILSNCEFM